MFGVHTRRLALLVAIATAALAGAVPATAGSPKAGPYKGTITPTDASDSNSNTPIKFKVKGSKIVKMKAEFFYGCWIGGSFTLQSYVFPSVHKGPIKIRRNGSFSAKDVVDKQAGFVVKMKGKAKRSKAAGTISLQTETRGNGCGRDFTFKAHRK